MTLPTTSHPVAVTMASNAPNNVAIIGAGLAVSPYPQNKPCTVSVY